MIDLAIGAAREAGMFLLEHIDKVQHIQQKDGEGRNLVSEIDRGSEEMIIRRVRERFPDHSIMAEEGGTGGNNPEYRWIIDPLDGTTNYLHGIPIYCVTIGIEKNGSLIGGVVYDPNQDELFVAEQGRGATLNGTPIRVSDTDVLSDSVLVTGFPYDVATNPDRAIERFIRFLKKSRGVRRLGSAALDLCWVGMGRFDGFWEVNLHPWDIAGGIVIVTEAGGSVTDFRGTGAGVDGKQILASNGVLHHQMVATLNSEDD
ncbi:MAG: inositol monophosphatase [Ignavibacteria bacterium]|nr:inositol monophosphatase [Ignavibacteria bacterium]